jgi:hypothetical protein
VGLVVLRVQVVLPDLVGLVDIVVHRVIQEMLAQPELLVSVDTAVHLVTVAQADTQVLKVLQETQVLKETLVIAGLQDGVVLLGTVARLVTAELKVFRA